MRATQSLVVARRKSGISGLRKAASLGSGTGEAFGVGVAFKKGSD